MSGAIVSNYTEEEKQCYVEEYQNSGLGITEYAREKNIPASTLRGWLSKNRLDAFGELYINTEPNSQNMKMPRIIPSTIFSTDKIRIELKEGFDKKLLQNIMEVLLRDDK